MARRKASQVPKVRKNYYVPKPLPRVMEFEKDGCPKRLKIDYKYGIGLALRNSNVPLRYHQVCNFIRVHMPKICCYKNDNWENCVRGALTKSKWVTAIDHVKEGQTRKNGYYEYKDIDGKDNWELKFPLDRYDPEVFLTYPELHEKLYYGQVGFPNEKEVEEARVEFMEARAKWRVVKKPTKRNASNQNDDEEEYYAPMAKRRRLTENQNQLEDEAEGAENGIEYFEGHQIGDQYVQEYNGLGEDEVLVEADDGSQYIVHRSMLQENVGSNGTFEQNVENQGQNTTPAQFYDPYNQHFQHGEQMMFMENGQSMQQNLQLEEQNNGPMDHQMEYQPFQDLTNVSSGNCNYQNFPVQGSSSQSNHYEVFDQGYSQPQENVSGSGIQQKAPEVENMNPSLFGNVLDFDAISFLDTNAVNFFF